MILGFHHKSLVDRKVFDLFILFSFRLKEMFIGQRTQVNSYNAKPLYSTEAETLSMYQVRRINVGGG